MASGNKSLIFNTEERVISPDHNRHQRFRDAMVAELLRSLVDTSFSTDDLDAGAVEVENATLNSPVTAEIFQGLRVEPQGGSPSVFVSDGVGMFMSPDSGADDSNLKYVSDPGVSSLGTLVIAANTSGSIRIDVVECQWGNNASVETDSRDVFSVLTGLFTPTLVSKVSAGVLNYRVRAGTPGSGFPGTASGWLPLAVVSVPNGSTTCDTCTFWDVRPLLTDREHSIFNMTSNLPAAPQLDGAITPNAWGVSVGSVLAGKAAAAFGGRRLGGRLRRGTPGSDAAASILLTDAANQEGAGVAMGTVEFFYVYLLTPFGLPRWARYTDGPSGRVPRSPRGIPVVSLVAPGGLSGAPGSAVSLPNGTGLGGSTSAGVCIAASTVGVNAGVYTPGAAAFTHGRQQTDPQGSFLTVSGSTIVAASLYKFTLTPGTNYPATARRLLVEVDFEANVNATSVNGLVELLLFAYQGSYASGVDAPFVGKTMLTLANPTGLGVNCSAAIKAEVPVPINYPSAQAPFDLVLQMIGLTGLTISNVEAVIFGWES